MSAIVETTEPSARQVVADAARRRPKLSLSIDQVSWLAIQAPRAVVGTRQTSDVTHGEADGGGDVAADRLGHGAVEVTEGERSQRDDAGPELQAGDPGATPGGGAG